MAVTFKGSQIYVNGAEPASGQLAGFTKNEKYTPLNSNDVNNSGFLTYTTTNGKPKAYIVGYSGNYYITKLTYYTSTPLESITLTLYCTGADNTSASNKIHRGFIVSTDSSLASSYSSFGSNSDSSIVFAGNELKSTVTYDSDIIPAGYFYIYLGPGNKDTSGTKYSSIYAIQSTFRPLSFSSVDATTYTISYDANGGSGTTPSHIVVKGQTTQLAENNFTAPADRLYSVILNGNGGNNGTPTYGSPLNRFYHWRENSIQGDSYNAGAEYSPSADTIFYAQWYTPAKMGTTTRASGKTDGYTVTFDANGGKCDTNSLTAQDTVDYKFDSWNAERDGSGTKYNSTSTYKIGSTRTLYAQWTETVNTGTGTISLPSATNSVSSIRLITLDYQGATGGNSNSTTTYIKTTTKSFEGWGTSSTSTSGSTGTYKPQKAETLYAVWGSASVTYSTATLPTPTKIGYTFAGWATSASATSGSFDSLKPSSDITKLYAIWKPDGNVRIYIDNKYKMALAYIYAPTSSSDAKPWKLTIAYLRNPNSSSDTKPWKIIAG